MWLLEREEAFTRVVDVLCLEHVEAQRPFDRIGDCHGLASMLGSECHVGL